MNYSQMVSESNGVVIYRKPSSDPTSSGFSFRGAGLVPASPRDTLALLWNLERYSYTRAAAPTQCVLLCCADAAL